MNYDPINLGPYVPADAYDLQNVALFSARMRKAARLNAWEKASQSDIYSEDEKSHIADFINWENQQDVYVSKITWQYIRQYLVEKRAYAYTLDQDGSKVVVPPDFWASDFAPQALSSGVIDIPLYKAKGRIFVRADSRKLIGNELYQESYDRYGFERLFKIHSIQNLKDQYAKQKTQELGSENTYTDYEEVAEERIKLPRGRRRTFNAEAYLIELVRILVRDRPDMSEYGIKKKIRSQVREAYKKSNDTDDLPDDDTLSRYLADILRDDMEQGRRLIAHKPE